MVMEIIISNIVAAIIGFFLGLPIKFFRFVIETPKNFWKIRFLTQTKYRKELVRLSISYLFKIEIDGKFLLIKNKNRIDQFQPVGGVYKYYNEVTSEFEKLKVTSDTGYVQDSKNKNDLRIMMPGKNVMKFFKWFFSKKNREVSQIREFYEEIIEPGFLKSDFLLNLKYCYMHSHVDDLKYSKHFKCQEILYAEIYNILLNKEEEEKIKEMISTNKNCFILVTQEEISRECLDIENLSTKIGRHANWLFKN